MLIEKEFYFVRHGQTDWNINHQAQGQTDVPLNATGRQQAKAAGQSAAHLMFSTIYSSPLSRAIETAEEIAKMTGGKISVLQGLAECSWGVREGCVKGVWFEKWKRGIEIPDGAELYEEFLDRALGAINQALLSPEPVLIVAHGGIYWAVQLYALRSMDEPLPNAMIVRHIPPSDNSPWWRTCKVS